MKMQVADFFGDVNDDVWSWVAFELTRIERDDQIEQVTATTDSCAKAIGRLIEILASKGQLSASEVHCVARGYYSDKVSLAP